MGRRAAAVGLLALALAIPQAAGAVTIDEFPAEPGATSATIEPRFIMTGPDGNLWFAHGIANGLSRIDPTGANLNPITAGGPSTDLARMTDDSVYWSQEPYRLNARLADGQVFTGAYEGDLQNPKLNPFAVARGPDGKVRWSVRQESGSFLGSICNFPPGGAQCHAPVQKPGGTRLTGIVTGPDDKIWAAAHEGDAVNRFAADGTPELEVPFPVGSQPFRIAVGTDGNLWVTAYGASAIDRVTPAGQRTRFLLPAGRGPYDIASGPDGALWFTEYDANMIGRMTTDGTLTNEYPVPTAASNPWGLTAGPDGKIWFTESSTAKVARLTLDPPPAPPPPDPGPPPPPDPGPAPPAPDLLAPVFTKALSMNPARFQVAKTSTPVTARTRKRVPKGTSLRFTLSEPASVTIAIARRMPGRRVGGRCRGQTRSNRRRPRCVRYVLKGTLRRQGLQGPNRVKFSGRIGKRALAPGRYRASATAKDAAGNASKPSRAAFTLVRR